MLASRGYLMLPTMCLTPFLIDAGYGGSEAVEALVDVFVAPVNLFDIAMVLVPFADMAANRSAMPARISGELIWFARRVNLWSCPMTTAR